MLITQILNPKKENNRVVQKTEDKPDEHKEQIRNIFDHDWEATQD